MLFAREFLSPLLGGQSIERFHSRARDQQPYWITETKECISVKIEFSLVWFTIMAAISLFWNINMAAVTSCENNLLQNVSTILYEVVGLSKSLIREVKGEGREGKAPTYGLLAM